jgi:hypothetical protein
MQDFLFTVIIEFLRFIALFIIKLQQQQKIFLHLFLFRVEKRERLNKWKTWKMSDGRSSFVLTSKKSKKREILCRSMIYWYFIALAFLIWLMTHSQSCDVLIPFSKYDEIKILFSLFSWVASTTQSNKSWLNILCHLWPQKVEVNITPKQD